MSSLEARPAHYCLMYTRLQLSKYSEHFGVSLQRAGRISRNVQIALMKTFGAFWCQSSEDSRIEVHEDQNIETAWLKYSEHHGGSLQTASRIKNSDQSSKIRNAVSQLDRGLIICRVSACVCHRV